MGLIGLERYTVVRELRVHELSQTDLVTLYQLHLLVWENYYMVYVHLISLRGILLYKIHYMICLSFRATCKGLLKHGREKEENALKISNPMKQSSLAS